LAKLEIAEEVPALLQAVVCVGREVHVGQWAAGEHITSKHLEDGLSVEAESGNGILCTEEQHEEGREQQADD